MPYVKGYTEPDKLRRLLKGYEFTAPRLASTLGCSTATAQRRLSDPASLTVEELRRINKRGHVPLEEIKEAL